MCTKGMEAIKTVYDILTPKFENSPNPPPLLPGVPSQAAKKACTPLHLIKPAGLALVTACTVAFRTAIGICTMATNSFVQAAGKTPNEVAWTSRSVVQDTCDGNASAADSATTRHITGTVPPLPPTPTPPSPTPPFPQVVAQ